MNFLTKAYEYTVESLADLEYLAHPLSLLDKFIKRDKEINSSLEIVYSGLLALGFPCYRYNIYRWAYHNRKRGELKLNDEQNKELSRQIGIYGIFRTIFLKRFESSLFSIHLSLENYEKKLKDFKKYLDKHNLIISVKNIKKLNDFLQHYNEQSAEEDSLDINIEVFEEGENGFEKIVAEAGVFNVDALKNDIKLDLEIIEILKKQLAVLIAKDNKIQVLADYLNTCDNRKVLIFSYFADTVRYLSNELPKRLNFKPPIEFAIGNKREIESMANRFAPVAKNYLMKPDDKTIQYLVATDKLSEGQNLQDCGIIINYDLHWNPVRMIQRNGRINRLGSMFDDIYINNFRPQEELESYLLLVRKLEQKINLIRYTIGSDQSVLDEEPIPQDFTEDLYSKDEKARLRAFEKILETCEFLAVDNLFMDDLREFDQSNEFSEKYKDAIKDLPKGKWGKITVENDAAGYQRLVHLVDKNDFPGYFIGFKKPDGIGERLNTSEGLIRIRATTENNNRYKDEFKGKIEFEKVVAGYIEEAGYIAETEHLNTYNKNIMEAINFLFKKMNDYGYPLDVIEKSQQCIFHTANAYIKKQLDDKLRNLSHIIRHNEKFDERIMDVFVELSKDFVKENDEPKQLHEFIHIFSV